MYEDITVESIQQNIINAMPGSIDKREGSYTRDMVAPMAVELWKLYTALNAVIPIAFIDDTSGKYIDKRAGEVGIIRKPGTKASVRLQFTGEDGTLVLEKTSFLTRDGLEYTTRADAVITSGTAQIDATAIDLGEEYNVPIGSITVQYNSIAGLSTVTNPEAASGGTNPESDAALVARYYAYLQEPSTSGNVHDYEKWALEVNGVGGVKVTPLQNGPGTVGILIVGPEQQPVNSNVVTTCAAHIEAQRPIGATVTVKSALGLTINVTAQVATDGSASANDIQEEFKKAVDAYLKTIAFKNYTVLYNRIGYLLLGINGISDYTELKVNGGTSNIKIESDHVPVLGAVTIS
jgi:uncharacterized phage protein gp47/JayE